MPVFALANHSAAAAGLPSAGALARQQGGPMRELGRAVVGELARTARLASAGAQAARSRC